MFSVIRPFPGVAHITDAMGVSFTLIEGSEKALLFDTGYGMEDVRAFVGTLTDKPVQVLLSHGHHDHILGARWFDQAYLCEEDMEEFRARTGELQRNKVKKQAVDAGVSVPDDFMTFPVTMPEAIRFTGKTAGYDSLAMDLGEKEVLVIRVPGHTPGSIVAYVPAHGLLLTGDDWNPCTWMWFQSSLAADLWRDNMIALLKTLDSLFVKGVEKVICSHQPAAREGKEIKEFLAYMTDERLKDASAVDMGAPINTHQVSRGAWTLIFDRDKITNAG